MVQGAAPSGFRDTGAGETTLGSWMWPCPLLCCAVPPRDADPSFQPCPFRPSSASAQPQACPDLTAAFCHPNKQHNSQKQGQGCQYSAGERAEDVRKQRSFMCPASVKSIGVFPRCTDIGGAAGTALKSVPCTGISLGPRRLGAWAWRRRRMGK